MLDNEDNTTLGAEEAEAPAPAKKVARKAPARKSAKKAAAAPEEPMLELGGAEADAPAPAKKAAAKKAAAKRTTKKAAAKKAAAAPVEAAEVAEAAAAAEVAVDAPAEAPADAAAEAPAPAKKAAAKKAAAKRTTKKAAAKKAAAAPVEAAEVAVDAPAEAPADAATEAPAPAKKAAAKRTRAKKAAAPAPEATAPEATAPEVTAGEPAAESATAEAPEAELAPVFQAPVKTTTRTRKRSAVAPEAATPEPAGPEAGSGDAPSEETAAAEKPKARRSRKKVAPAAQPTEVPDEVAADDTEQAEEQPADGVAAQVAGEQGADQQEAAGDSAEGEVDAETGQDEASEDETSQDETSQDEAETGHDGANEDEESPQPRRRRRRGGRRRRKSSDADGHSGDHHGEDDESGDADRPEAAEDASGKGEESSDAGEGDSPEGDGEESTSGSRRRRRRRRAGDAAEASSDDPANTVTKVRQGRSAEDQITAVSGSTRLEAKKQRRREGREAGRRRAPIVSEAEFLARRESVDRQMVVRQKGELTQIAVLEDKVLVEHYVSRESQNSLIGNVYVGRVQNVLPSMEAAFVDIGKGRNAVLYAGEVNWAALGHKEGQPRKIESVLSSGQSVLVQVTKDPIGHKGARLTSQISLAGRFLVYVPDGTTSGISRKLPDTERARLKSLLKEIVPESAGVIVRTAAEGASEEELTRDVERLKARWEDIEAKSKTGNAPKLLYGEPDLTLKVVRDLFTEDFASLVVEGDEAWETVHGYVEHMAPDLLDRVHRFEPGEDGRDSFAAHRIDEQIAKGLDRKVWLPSGGSLIIDRTEAMTVVDVNTGKFTGSGGNLEETVTKNNLEAAEEIVRQLRLRDIGGIIVVDFIDMVLESNRDLVLRRLVECLGRDRTRHQVAEVTSLGLVQMTRKRIGTGLLEAFSENCEHCGGRGLVVHDMPIEPKRGDDDNRRRRRGKGGDQQQKQEKHEKAKPVLPPAPSPKDIAAIAHHENADQEVAEGDQGRGDQSGPARSDRTQKRGKGQQSGRAEQTGEQAGEQAAQDEQPTSTEQSGQGEQSGQSEAAAPAVTVRTRSRRGRGRSAEARVGDAEAAVDPVAVTPQERPAGQPAGEPVHPASESVAAESVAPGAQPDPADGDASERGATGATGAAGAEAATPAAGAVVVVTGTRRGARSGVITPKPVEPIVLAPTAPAAAEEPVASAAAPPKVVTRTRSRGGASSAPAESASSADEQASEPVELHVPIKKKGSRKR